jgi:signal transduction histidine kinase
LVITVPPEARLVADPDLLAAALANLLDNALRHGATQLGITVIQEHGHTRLVLTDDGPGIAEPERLRLQTALDQQDYQRCPGMGLMLADLVARAHGGALRLASSTTGCTVEMTLA